MTSLASLVAMTLLAACMAAPLIADRLFSRDLLEPAPQIFVTSPAPVGMAAK